ncbi:MAG TPA: hypothetical protein G4N97_11395, partial [Thermoflexia bacterium]|nr:hypothetical protein [Thermoflexia bacterium]
MPASTFSATPPTAYARRDGAGGRYRLARQCGLPGGAGEVNNALIWAALEAGALGAKLTGAGGGGSVFALARPGCEEELVEALRAAASEAGLEHARVWRAHVDRDGLQTETAD